MREADGPKKVSISVTRVSLTCSGQEQGLKVVYWLGTGSGDDFSGHGPCEMDIYDDDCRDAARHLADKIETYLLSDLTGEEQSILPPKGII